MPRKSQKDRSFCEDLPPEAEHKQGRETGYETDGKDFWLAGVHVASWGVIQDNERAMDSLIRAMALAMHEWDRVYRDLGLDPNVKYAMDRIARKLILVEDKPAAG